MWRRRIERNPEATKALADAQESLERVKKRGSEVREVAEASKEFRRKNHFADQLGLLFNGPMKH